MIFRILPKMLDDYDRQYEGAKDVYDRLLNPYYITTETFIVERYEKRISISGMACVLTLDPIVGPLLIDDPFPIYERGFFIKHMKFRLIEL